MTRLILTPEADDELEQARVWCLETYPATYRQFVQTIADAIDEVAKAPLRWAIWKAHYRRRVLLPYPYAVIYHVTTDHAVVIDGFFHTSQDPERRFR